MKQELNINTQDGVARAWLFYPSLESAAELPGIIYYMDALGPREAIFEMGQRLADAGYVVLLPDLFYRSGSYGPYDGEAFNNETSRNEIIKMMGDTTQEMTMRDTTAFLHILAGVTNDGPIGVVGYCMGGGRAIAAAATFPDRISAAASFHGGNLASDKADSPHLLANRIKARVYVGTAGIDASFPPEQSARLDGAFRNAGVDYMIENYVGVQHGWTVPDRNKIYDEAGSERHWRRLLSLFAETLGQSCREGSK